MSSWHPPIEIDGIDFEKLDTESRVFFRLVLAGKPLTVTDLCKATNLTHQSVCYHVQQLLDQGLIYCTDHDGRTAHYSPQDYYKDSRILLRLWDRLAQFTSLLADEMDFGCVINGTNDSDDPDALVGRVESAIIENIRMFLSLFHSQGGIRLDPTKLKE